MTMLWFILMVVFLIMEASTVTVVSIWFVVGALAALILSMLEFQLWVQVLAFLAVSCLLLALLRPVVKRFFTPRIVKTNVDGLIGSVGKVTQTIDNVNAKGQVKLGAMEWTARSVSGESIPEGTLVRVVRIEGVKAMVEPAAVPAETK